MRASIASRRCMIAMLDISRVKKPTGIFCRIAMLAAIVRARAVLPTDGRAPMTMNSEFWKPFVRLSSSVNPEGTPV